MTSKDTTDSNVVPLSANRRHENTAKSVERMKKAVAKMDAVAKTAVAATAELNAGLATLNEQLLVMEARLRHCDEVYSSSIRKLQASRAQSGNI